MPIRIARAALVLALCTAPAHAQRASTTAMSCGQAKTLVDRRGGLVLGTGGQTYDRFVRDRSFCELTEIAELRFVPTRDNPQCPIGYRCREPDYGDWNWDAN